ncbi:MAG: AMP-binding protein, partial [Alphaproteobacteria bacterium]|nr:AMP-binding protein [Alphaproteobacteria bacterium]
GLRTRLVLRGDEVLQEIDPPRVSVLDDPRPLSLSEGPAWSCSLRSEAGERVLELTFAHGACDGRSLIIAATELGQLYRAALGEPLSPLPAQMADFAAWQRAAAGAAWAEDLAWWVDALRGLPHLELPLRGARPPRKGRTGALHQRALPSALAAQMRRSERSAFVLTLTALTATLARYTGQRDLAIGVPVGARPHADAEPLIGMFLNPVVLRQRFDGDPSLGALLQAAQATTTAALARAQVPFEAVLDALRPERDLSLTPLYQVSLNHLDLSEARLNLPGVEAEPLPRPTPAAHADLSVHLVTEGEALTLAVVRDVELLEAEQAEALLQHLQEALEALLRAPDTALSALALSAPTLPPPPGLPGALPWRDAQTLSERLHEVSLAHPEGLAVLAEGQRWTWGRLAAQVEAVASALEAHPGRHVGLLLGRDGWMVAGLLGTLAAGRVAVLIDPAFPAGRRAFIEQDAEVELLLTTAALDPGVGPPRLHLEALAPQPPRLRTPDPDALAYILYTSGSTGRPKGVMQNQRSALLHARTYAERLGLGPEDRLSLASTYAFDAGLMDIFGAVCAGAALCPLTLGAELDRAPTQLAALGVSVFHATPTLFRHVARCADPAPLDRVRVVVLGGEEALATDHDALRARFSPDCALINGLGPTESTLALQHLVTQRPARASLPVGGPVGGARVRLETPLGPQPALFGVGELVLESPRVALGYWRRPEETAAAFQDAPRRYRTGDLARILPGGVLEFAGRGDRQVEVRGHRVELGEIEARVLARGASEVAVTSGLSGLVAWVVGAPDLEALRAGLREELPSWMRPRLIALDALPRTPTGKLDRRALHERRPEPAPAASGALARRVAEVFAELLSLPAVGPEDDFFELGGHSLLAVQAARRLSLALEQEVSLAALFECATPARLAERLGSRAAPLQPTVIRRGALPVVVFGPLGARREAGLRQLAEVLQRPALLVEASPDAPSLSALAERVLAELPPMSAAVGWSNGGLLAFEVARQAGVPALLLDSPAPTAPPAPGVQGFAAQLLGDSRLEVGSLEVLLERALADERVPARTSLQELEGMMAAYAQARSPVRALLRGWAPRPLRTPLVYLRARDTRWRVDPLPGWAALAEGGWRVEALPGEHFALRDPAQARTWGARVLEALGLAQRG